MNFLQLISRTKACGARPKRRKLLANSPTMVCSPFSSMSLQGGLESRAGMRKSINHPNCLRDVHASLLPEEVLSQISDFAIDSEATVLNAGNNSVKLVQLISDNVDKTLLQRHACDAITLRILCLDSTTALSVYSNFISARNAAIRAPRPQTEVRNLHALEIRKRLIDAGAVEATTEMLSAALSGLERSTSDRSVNVSSCVASMHSAIMALCTLVTDMENDGQVHARVKTAEAVQVLVHAVRYAVQHDDHQTCVFAWHALGSLTYEPSVPLRRLWRCGCSQWKLDW